ncbi:aminoglycoside phosphotransferase family protein [Nonomuraea sp. NPDC003754]
MSGSYNKNVRVDTASGPVIVRIPMQNTDAMDLRIWREDEVMAAIAPYVTQVPRLLHVSPSPVFQVHEFIGGHVLEDVAPCGQRTPVHVCRDVTVLFRQLADVPLEYLPALPADWPATVSAFANVLTASVQGVYDTFVGEFGSVFADLSFPADPLAAIRARWPLLTERRFGLVHADVHRKNMIVTAGRTFFLDWELALWGDPVYDLAVHFHKMAYHVDEREAVQLQWLTTMPGEATQGWQADLPAYLAQEQVKTAIVHTVRYTKLIREGVGNTEELIDKLLGELIEAHAIWETRPPTRKVIEVATRRPDY